MNRPVRLARRATSVVAAALLLLIAAVPVSAVQTFPDPFGDGIHSDIRVGSNGEDIGDAFFLRDGAVLSIRMFLAFTDQGQPRSFSETHVCLSGEAFTTRIPPGQCQFQAQGAAASSYDITLPPSFFPIGNEPFDDPLGAFCAQVHVKYVQPELSLTRDGGGSAFAGWQSGRPFYGNICFPNVPDPLPPGEGTAVVSKVGELVGGDVAFTVTATNPTTEIALDVVVLEALPAKLTPWTVPPECTLNAVDFIARCEIGDLAGGASFDLVFSATPPDGVCGSFSNFALTTVGSPVVRSNDLVIVDVPCPPDPPPDPLILMTKDVSSTSVTVPNTVSYFVTFENAGPGPATNVSFTDELSPTVEWSLGSGSEVCTIDGSTLICFAETVPDGVFEVLEIIGTVDANDCGTFDNTGTATFEGGQEPGSVSATAPTLEVTGCPAEGAGAGDEGDLPDTSAAAPVPIAWFAAAMALLAAAWVVTLRARRRRFA